MPDQTIPLDVPASERRSRPRPSGLPIFVTERLTAAERDGLRNAARALRLAADKLDEARALDRVAFALQATVDGLDAGRALDALATTLGSLR